MADVEVKKTNKQPETTPEHRQETGARRDPERRGWSGAMDRPRFFGDLLWSSPFSMMRRMVDEMDRAISSFGSEAGGQFMPAIEVTERDGNLVVCADLPGIRKEDVKVEVTDDAVIIEGERKREEERTERGYHRTERSYGRFYRTIPLPEGADGEKAKAEFRDGELQVRIPLSEPKRRGRQIPIESGTSG
jgi:HSP20 family protein